MDIQLLRHLEMTWRQPSRSSTSWRFFCSSALLGGNALRRRVKLSRLILPDLTQARVFGQSLFTELQRL